MPIKQEPKQTIEAKELTISSVSQESSKNFGKFMEKQLEKEEVKKIYVQEQ